MGSRGVTIGIVAALGVTLSAARSSALQGSAGTAVITGDAGECSRAISVQLWSLTRSPFGRMPELGEQIVVWTGLADDGGPLTISLGFITARPADGQCRWTFGGLRPGEYVAAIVTPDGSGGSQPFAVSAQATILVAIPAPQVLLTGQISRGGSPARANVRVTSFPFSRPTIVFATDANGRYRVTLDRPGLHRIEAVTIGTVEAELETGSNVVNVPTDDPAVRVIPTPPTPLPPPRP